MKTGFERGPLSLPTQEEDFRREFLDEREVAERIRNKLIYQLGEVEDMAAHLDIDLDNGYDKRMVSVPDKKKSNSYVVVRNWLLAHRMAVGIKLEKVEELLDEIAEGLGESRAHDV